MTSVNTNIAGLTARYNLENVNRDLETTMERLSTGKRTVSYTHLTLPTKRIV